MRPEAAENTSNNLICNLQYQFEICPVRTELCHQLADSKRLRFLLLKYLFGHFFHVRRYGLHRRYGTSLTDSLLTLFVVLIELFPKAYKGAYGFF